MRSYYKRNAGFLVVSRRSIKNSWGRGSLTPIGVPPESTKMAKRPTKATKRAEAYQHDEKAVLRPEAGTQAQFKKKKPPKTYRYDSSLSPALDWDGQNHARDLGEWLLAQVEEAGALDPPHRFPEPRGFGDVVVEGLDDAVREMKAIGRPFLDSACKA